MRDQVGIKNVEIRVKKQDRVWNDDKEEKNEERESNGWIYCNCESSRREEQNYCDCKLSQREQSYWCCSGEFTATISLMVSLLLFLGKRKLEIIFMKLVEWVTNLND